VESQQPHWFDFLDTKSITNAWTINHDLRAARNRGKQDCLANKLRISIVAAGTHEALHVMRADPQIASRFEQLELPVWTESQELRRFIAGYLALLPIKRASAAIDKRFVEYLLELSECVTGRIIEVLRRAALQGIADKAQKVGLVQLQVVGAKMPSVVGQRAYIFPLGHP
jgi:hypothetical protein